MIDGASVLALVPARGGSKGLPGKNIRPLRGKPLIAWSIEAGQASQYIDEVVVSTDLEEIAAVARAHGAAVPFLRPAVLASDSAPSVDVIEHALEYYSQIGRRFDIIVLLEPTSPLRDAADIDAALEKMQRSQADAVVSVCLAETVHPAFMFKKGVGERLQTLQGGPFKPIRRQDLEALYFLEGSVYASRIETLLAARTFCQENLVGYEVEKWKSPEIDDMIDFLHVEAIMRHRDIGVAS